MANDITTGNPWILDTAADNIKAPTVDLYPKALIWSGSDLVTTSELQLEDGNERVVLLANPDVAKKPFVFYFPEGFVMRGLSLGTLSHGKVYLFF
jgi:hypothetical protein